MKKIKVFEAFAGIGAQHEAFDALQKTFPGQVQFEFAGVSEIDRMAYASYCAAHGNVRNYGDISKIDWDNVADFDCFTMSSPCQDFSTAGKQAGGEEGSGTRSSLLWECRRAIIAKRPKWIIFENVPAILSKKFRPGFERWQRELESYGYVNFVGKLNSKDYGVPQSRLRCFMVSILRTGSEPHPTYNFPKPFPLARRLRDVLERNVDESYYLKPEQVGRIVEHCNRKQSEGCGFKPNFVPPQGVGGTILTSYGQRETDTYISESGCNEPDGNSQQ